MEESAILPGFWGQLANVIAGKDAMTPSFSPDRTDTNGPSAPTPGADGVTEKKGHLEVTDTWNCSPWGTGQGWLWVEEPVLRKSEVEISVSRERGVRAWIAEVWRGRTRGKGARDRT